ncbi:hypothetical protein AWC38_SpisGene639 [Stylophora pistillata]|uniref:DDE Tnp4 domain-containing protein n=1 Tax=Stylophora pistillata TaxID=50429 RepID=A0A2B4T1H5_STYPI|nr:hypothetical protein AWC38_SpisGene639 [Stylophora pistillata]
MGRQVRATGRLWSPSNEEKQILIESQGSRDSQQKRGTEFQLRVTKANEFASLYDVNQPKNPPFPYVNYEEFSLENLSDEECIAEFRVERSDLPIFADTVGTPPIFRCSQRSVCDGMEGLCMLLKRLACDHRKGAPLNNCWGFIDGTVCPICRPLQNQRIVYNGQKRVHSLKFQSIATPNDLIANLYGPVEGRRHDSGMLADSGVYNELARNSFDPAGHPLCLYGDPAYPLRVYLQAPFRNVVLTQQKEDFNSSMSAVHPSVEWLFTDIINDFKKNLKIDVAASAVVVIVIDSVAVVVTATWKLSVAVASVAQLKATTHFS